MSRFVLCNCPVGFAADPERHAPDCPGRSGAGKPSLAPAAGSPRVHRHGMEFWDKICALKHYGFLLAPEGNRVVKAEGIGNWIDMHEAQQVVDAAQSEINGLRAERDQGLAREAVLTARLEQKITEIIDEATKAIDSYRKEAALQDRLNVTDQKVDDLTAENAALCQAVKHSAMRIKELDLMFGRYLLGMQSAVIEQEHGKGAEEAMRWIFNGLAGPGVFAPDDATDAQAYFDREIVAIDAGMQEVLAFFDPSPLATSN